MRFRLKPSVLWTSLFSVGLSGMIVLLLWQTPFWHIAEKRSFDIASILFPPTIERTDIVIVGIDDASFIQLNQPWPWPRAWHGKLLDRLNQAGARMVVFDLILDTPSRYGIEDDYGFAQSIANFPHTYLGYYQQHQQLPEGYQVVSIEPLSLYQQAGAKLANVAIIPDEDGIVRLQPQFQDSVWKQVLHQDNTQTNEGNKLDKPRVPVGLTRFIGDANSFPFVSYYRALEPNLLPDNTFKDKIVLVGLNILAPADVGLQADDRYATPFSLANKQLMAGIELHANFIESARRGLTIRSISNKGLLIIIALLNVISGLLFIKWQAFRSALIWAAGCVSIVMLQWYLFTQLWYVPLFSCLLVWTSNYLIQGGFAYRREQKDRRFITKAFSRYVSPHVLDELIKQPEKLALGGTRKPVTIMFTDLAGFTQLSESLEAETVASLLQTYLTRMSAIVVKHGGTLDKYIGDAIMAFWGAPLPDDKQVDHAVNAALEMQDACKAMRQELEIELHMRIGVHSGDAIVGNMGSDSLFDYTCIGDNVNTAARLESINKQYGTDILLSESVKQHITTNIQCQLVDFVKLKGKNRATKIYTPTTHSKVAQLSEQGFEAYAQQAWSQAEQCFAEIVTIAPDNQAAILFLKRITSLKHTNMPPDWDGSYVADRK